MARIKIIAVGNIKENYLVEGIRLNLKKIKTKFNINLIEIKEYRLKQNPNPAEINKGLSIEAERIEKHLDKNSYLAVCDVIGNLLSTNSFKSLLETKLYQEKRNITFIIGGSFGLDPAITNKANLKISFSKMTFTHQLMRLILLEQLVTSLH